MCLVISGVCSYLSYSFYMDGNFTNAAINGAIALLFLGLLTRNIIKTKKDLM